MQRRTVMLLAGSTLFAFALLASQVVTNAYLAATADPAVTRWLAERRTAGLTYFFLAVSAMHSTLGIDVMLGIVAVHRGIVRREWPSALWLVAAVQSSMLLNVGLKMAFARHRPVFAEPLVDLTTYSFPSGHALASTVLWGCVWLLLPRGAARHIAGWAFVVVVATVCVSRVYLGAHFLTDVLAGAIEGVFCLTAWSMVRPATHSRLP